MRLPCANRAFWALLASVGSEGLNSRRAFCVRTSKRTPNARFLALSNDQLIDVGTTQAHRLQVAFTAAQLSAIAQRAGQSGLSHGAVIRELVSAALSLDTDPGTRADSPAALAALVAAELAALMVAAVLPDGRRRLQDLAPEAAAAAAARLAMFREVE